MVWQMLLWHVFCLSCPNYDNEVNHHTNDKHNAYCTDGDDDDDSPLLMILKQFRSLSALRDSIANAGSFIIV